jgi:hypothetical protein
MAGIGVSQALVKSQVRGTRGQHLLRFAGSISPEGIQINSALFNATNQRGV